MPRAYVPVQSAARTTSAQQWGWYVDEHGQTVYVPTEQQQWGWYIDEYGQTVYVPLEQQQTRTLQSVGPVEVLQGRVDQLEDDVLDLKRRLREQSQATPPVAQ